MLSDKTRIGLIKNCREEAVWRQSGYMIAESFAGI